VKELHTLILPDNLEGRDNVCEEKRQFEKNLQLERT
jgi:hypothetical protein